MSLRSTVMGMVRGLAVPSYAEGAEQILSVNSRGEQIVSQGLPPLAEVVRQGDSWGCCAAPVAPITVYPSTAAGLHLYNDEPATGKCYVIDSFGCVEIVTDTTQQNSLALFAQNCIANSVVRATATDGGFFKPSMSGRPTYGGKARINNTGITIVDSGWTPHGPASPGATAFAGAVWRVHEYPANGLYVVPPGGGLFCIVAAKSVATAAQVRYFVRWHEVQMIFKA